MTLKQIRQFRNEASVDTERRLLKRELAAAGWRLSAAAKALRCSVSTLHSAVNRHPTLKEKMVDARYSS